MGGDGRAHDGYSDGPAFNGRQWVGIGAPIAGPPILEDCDA